VERLALYKLHKADWKRIHAEIAKARHEAREAVERARPEIERAIAQVKSAELQIKARGEAVRAVREARPQIEAAMKIVGPEIERALAEAREDLRKAHIDATMEKTIDRAMRNAQVKMLDAHGDTGEDNSAVDDADETAPDSN
jgi:hypothetical protein